MFTPNVPNHPEFTPASHHSVFNVALALWPETPTFFSFRSWHLVDDGTLYVGFRNGLKFLKLIVPLSALNRSALKSFEGFGMDAGRRATARHWWRLHCFEDQGIVSVQEEIGIDDLGRVYLAGYREAFLAVRADLELLISWAV